MSTPPRRKPVAPHAGTKPRTRKPRAAKVARRRITFQSRGQYKCVRLDGRSVRGVHPALHRALSPRWNYAAAEAAGTLVQYTMPRAWLHLPVPELAAQVKPGPPCNAAKGGTRLDQELTRTVKLYLVLRRYPPRALAIEGAPPAPPLARVFHDAAARRLYLDQLPKQGQHWLARRKALERLRLTLPETRMLWVLMEQQRVEPLQTQLPVAHGNVGTKLDLVVQSLDNQCLTVVEVKRGCDVAFGNGTRMLPPFADRGFDTHSHYALQTLVSHLLFKRCVTAAQAPGATTAPWLVRCSSSGVHVYLPPAWAVAKRAELLQRVCR